MQMIALEPPGNVARDLALFRRGLFAGLGEGSALAFPETIPLAFAAPGDGIEPRALDACWDGIDGSFSSSGLVVSRGLLYLAIGGPLAPLRARAADAFRARAPSYADPPLEAGLGVFLCKPADPPLALALAERIGPPRASFRDCALVLLKLRLGADPFAALVWREFARSKRRTG